MSDWEMVSVNKNKPNKYEESDWELSAQNPPDIESKGFGGIASDAYNKGLDTALNIPSQLMNLPGELFGAGKQIITEPKRALQNLGAGFGELGHGILSAPANIRDYLQKKDIISENAPSFRIPESILPNNYNYPEALGIQGEESGDTLLRAIPKTVALSPATKLLPLAKSGLEKIRPKGPYEFIQKAYDKKEKSLGNIFKDVSNQAKKEDIKIEIPKNLIKEIKKSGPKTDRFANFVDKSKTGDYDSLRKLQTELFTRGKGYKTSQLASENDFGDLLFEHRSKLNDAIIKSLEKSGRPDLAKLLTTAKHGWKELEETYHANPKISALVGKERKVPLTYTPLRQKSTFIKNLKKEHPEIQKKLNNIRRAKQISALIGGLGLKKYIAGNNNYNDYRD